jgi:hypothetical protein
MLLWVMLCQRHFGMEHIVWTVSTIQEMQTDRIISVMAAKSLSFATSVKPDTNSVVTAVELLLLVASQMWHE